MVLIDAYKGYEKFIEKYLTDGEKKPLTGVINKSQYTKTEGFVTYALFGQSKQSVEKKLSEIIMIYYIISIVLIYKNKKRGS